MYHIIHIVNNKRCRVLYSLHVFGFQMLHDRARQEAPSSVVVGHDVGLPVPGQLLQSIAAAAQPGFAVGDPVEALAVGVKAVPEAPHLRHDDEVLPVEPAGQETTFLPWR